MDKYDISKVFSEMSQILEIMGENVFKVRAYENAARSVAGIDDLEKRIKEETLTEIAGIGKNMAAHIVELHKTGKIKEYEALRKKIPHGLLDMLAIPGLGAKRVKFFFEKLHIEDIGDLELVCRHGTLRTIKGYGEKTEQKILAGIAYLRKNLGQHLYSEALSSGLDLFDKLSKHPKVSRAEIAGSLRRKKEIIKDVDIVASTKAPKEVMTFFTTLPEVEKIEGQGETKASVALKTGINADLRTVSEKEFPYALLHFTGSVEHNVALRKLAIKNGMKLNEYGLFKVSGEKETLVPCKDEAEIYAALGLQFIPPEMRENMGEVELAEKNALPKIMEEKDLKGVLHIHSNYSDGVNTIEEMANHAKSLGYSYIGICDHSQSAFYAGGLKEDTLKKQFKEIDSLNKKLKGITILKGIESDILIDGSLDYPDKILEKFDFVIASVHSRFNLPEEEMTERVCKALANPYLTMLGHPTGRLLLGCEGYKINMQKVIDTAAKYNAAIEINANPHRLDLDWRLCIYAKSKGVKIAICPDAHSTENMLDIMFGVGIARKGWLTKEDVLNTWDVDKFMTWVKNRNKS